jgi:ubiquinone/menaquinone biosynthesis C-methylase UbiE
MNNTYDDKLASDYDKHAFIWRTYIPMVEQILAEYDAPTVLDLGCGTGSLLLSLKTSI